LPAPNRRLKRDYVLRFKTRQKINPSFLVSAYVKV
jgi:hypothetical protein